MTRLERGGPEPSVSTPSGDTFYVLKRAFHEGRMDRGGRLYGDWQYLPAKERLKLRIDGSSVCEIDATARFCSWPWRVWESR